MPALCFRDSNVEAPRYDKESTQFSLKIQHSGYFFRKPNSLVYEHGGVEYVDHIESSTFNKNVLEEIVCILGLTQPMGFLFRRRNMTLLHGLIKVMSTKDVKKMLDDRNGAHCIEVYFVPLEPTLQLPWNGEIPVRDIVDLVTVGYKPKSSVVIEEINELESQPIHDSTSRATNTKAQGTGINLNDWVDLEDDDWHSFSEKYKDMLMANYSLSGEPFHSSVDGQHDGVHESGKVKVNEFDGGVHGKRKALVDELDMATYEKGKAPVDELDVGMHTKGKAPVDEYDWHGDCDHYGDDYWNSADDERENDDDDIHNDEGPETREKEDGLHDSDYETGEEVVPDFNEGPNLEKLVGAWGNSSEQGRGSDTDYGELSELESLDSEGEETFRRRKRCAFNSEADMHAPRFRLGQEFESKKILKMAVDIHAIQTHRDIKVTKNDATRLRFKCKDCLWELYARKSKDDESFVIKKYHDQHNCSMLYKNRRVNSRYLSERYLAEFRSEPNLSAGGFTDRVKRDALGDISIWTFYRTKNKANEKIRGAVAEQYKVIWDYCEQLRATDRDTTTYVEARRGTEFRRLYICLGALKRGFRKGCRRVIGVDRCFLKTDIGGHLLTAVGVDGNNGVYPIAYAVVDSENYANWLWFLKLLREDLQINCSGLWTFISDKQKGLVKCIADLFEEAEHRMCVCHLYNNFSGKHKGLVLKNLLWRAARSTTMAQFEVQMRNMKEIDMKAHEWLEKKPASQWSKSHFRDQNKCDMQLNNLCESFNSVILHAREKPLLTMLEQIRAKLMTRLVSKKEGCEKWKKNYGPRIKKIIEKNFEATKNEFPTHCGNGMFQVNNYFSGSLHAVDVNRRTCSCRSWQLTGLPCSHALASFSSRNISPDDHIDEVYSKDWYLLAYSEIISPLTGPEQWPNIGQHPLTPPVVSKKKAGRPQKKRRKEANEHASSSQVKTPATGKASRKGMKMTCRKCRMEGHNARSCKSKMAPPAAD